MPKAADLIRPSPNILLLGPAGCGKTSYALTLGQHLHIIDIDGNVLAGLHCSDGLDDVRSQVEVTQVETEPGDPKAFDRVIKVVEKIRRQATKETPAHPVIAIDSLTSLAESSMLRAQQANGTLVKAPSMQEWGTMGREVERLILQLKAAPISLILIAHDEISEINGENDIRLGVMGQHLKKVLPKRFSDMWYMRTRAVAGGGQSFEVITRPRGIIKARSSADLPPMLDATEGLMSVFEALGHPLGDQVVHDD